MEMPSEVYTNALRIKGLEQQIQKIKRELQRLHKEVLKEDDNQKLNSLMERLHEFNAALSDLAYQNYIHQSKFQKETNGSYRSESNTSSFDSLRQNRNSSIENLVEKTDRNSSKCHKTEKANMSQNKSSTEVSRENTDDPFRTCKQLMEETKSSKLEKHLITLKDFRADPELHRQRLERKRQEKLKRRSLLEKKSDFSEENRQVKRSDAAKSLSDTSTSKKHEQEDFKGTTDNKPHSRRVDISNSRLAFNLPVVKNNLPKVIEDVIRGKDKQVIALNVVLENDLLYHVSVSDISNGRALACFFATEEAVQEAKKKRLFEELLTFFVMDSDNSDSQKDRILGHLFEVIKVDIK